MSTIQGAGGIFENNYEYTWNLLTETNANGNGISIDRNVANLTFGVFGTGSFGTSGAVQLQGSMDNVNWVQLKDLNGNAISITANAIISMANPPRYLRPAVTAGTGVSVVAYIHGTVFN